jgi:hypothetical protein
MRAERIPAVPLDPAPAAALAADAVTALAGAANAIELWARRAAELRLRRRAALAALTALNAGIAVQASFAFALFSAYHAGDPLAPWFSPAAWLASRIVILAAALALTALIWRARA